MNQTHVNKNQTHVKKKKSNPSNGTDKPIHQANANQTH